MVFAMKKFHITVNGTAYEVDVEEIGAAAAPVAAPAASAAPAAPAAAAPFSPWSVRLRIFVFSIHWQKK